MRGAAFGVVVLMAALASSASLSREVRSGDPMASAAREGPVRGDALLAALGVATLDCLGTVSRAAYAATENLLVRTFDACTSGDRTALEQIDALLGVQRSTRGRADRLGRQYVGRWKESAGAGRITGNACPSWTPLEGINLPTRETVRPVGSRPDVRRQKSGARYAVTSPRCTDARCAVENALACAAGFGEAFIVGSDPRRGEVTVDPVWWLWNDEFDEGENPFETPGYYHGMSYYGRIPGDRYGALARAGEKCSRYDEISGKHYIHVLEPIECTAGWYCMTYCM